MAKPSCYPQDTRCFPQIIENNGIFCEQVPELMAFATGFPGAEQRQTHRLTEIREQTRQW